MALTVSDAAIDRALPALRRMVEQYEARQKIATQPVPEDAPSARAASSGRPSAVAS